MFCDDDEDMEALTDPSEKFEELLARYLFHSSWRF